MKIVSFSSIDGSPETARIGPGTIAMHVSVEKSYSLDNSGKVTIFPIFTVMSTNTIPEISMMEKTRDFPFTSAALQLDMSPGDFIFMAPERLITDQTTLCGLFFSKPYDSLFLETGGRKPPERKQSVRVYLLTCVGVNL